MANHVVLYALAEAVTQVDEAAAYRAIRSIDPLLRWWGRRRVAAALRHAHLSVRADRSASPTAHQLHVLQAAYLHAALGPSREQAAAQLGDAHLTKAAYRRQVDEVPPKRPTPRRWVTPLVATLVAASVAALAFLLWPRSAPADTPLGKALVDDLTSWVVAVDRLGPTRPDGVAAPGDARWRAIVAEHRAAVLSPEVRHELGDGGITALQRMMDSARAFATDPDATANMELRRVAFREGLVGVNDVLRARHKPFFVDGDWQLARGGQAQIALFVFGVDRRTQVTSDDGVTVDVVHMHRLDRLNWQQGFLGYTRRSMKVAVVLLDKIEDQLVTYIGPAMANFADMPIFGGSTTGWRQAVEAEAGRVARLVFEKALPDDLRTFRDFGALLRKRKTIVDGWQRSLSDARITLRTPGTLALPDEAYRALEQLVPDFEVRELRSVQEEIESAANLALFRRMRDRFAQVVERHEAQHRIDYARGNDFPVPAVLAARVGQARAADGSLPRRLERAVFEASAYLSEIGREDQFAPLNLALLAVHAFNAGGAEYHAAVAIFDGLAETLGMKVRVTDTKGRDRRRYIADTYLALSSVPTAKLVAAGKALWKRWFGKTLPVLTQAQVQ